LPGITYQTPNDSIRLNQKIALFECRPPSNRADFGRCCNLTGWPHLIPIHHSPALLLLLLLAITIISTIIIFFFAIMLGKFVQFCISFFWLFALLAKRS
jgi:hypothetical protein